MVEAFPLADKGNILARKRRPAAFARAWRPLYNSMMPTDQERPSTEPQSSPPEFIQDLDAPHPGAGQVEQADRQRYEHSLSLLHATLESTTDGLLVVDLNGRVVLHNNRFRSMWSVPPDLAATSDDSRLLAHVAAQFEDPAAFERRARELYAQPEEESFDEVVPRDGRIIERYSKAQRIGGRCVGRVWSFRDVTERRQAEQRLREGEARYRHLFAQVPISIWEVDHTETWRWVEELAREGVTDLGAYFLARPEAVRKAVSLARIVNVSDSSVAMFDASSKEELIANYASAFTEETCNTLAAFLVGLTQGRPLTTAELSVRTLRGRRIDIRAQWSVPLRDGRMDLSRLIVTVDDITERRRVEQQLREGETRYRHLLGHVPLSVWEADYTDAWAWVEDLGRMGITDLRAYLTERPEAAREFVGLLRFVDVSDYSLRMFDASSKPELIARLPELFTEETFRGVWGSLVAISEGRTQYAVDVPVITLKGRRVDVRALWAIPTLNGRIDLSHLIVAVDDITERTQAQRQLADSEARYRHLFAHTPISIWEQDFTEVGRWMAGLKREGVSNLRAYIDARPEAPRNAMKLVRVRDVSDASLAMFDAPDKATLMNNVAALFTEESYRRMGDMLVWIWEGRMQNSGEITGVTLKGRRVDMLVHWAIPTVDGRPDLSRVVIAIDDISERVRLQDELLKSQKLESIGTLAGGIAHDFNNLLAVVVGQASMQLRDRSLPARLRESLKDILHAAERGSALTQQLLAYARGGWQRPVPVDLNVVIGSVMKILRRALPPQVEVAMDLTDDLAQVMADPSQIEQVVMNLCLNAAQASTAPGRVQVSTDAARLDEARAQPWGIAPGDYVRLRVRDFGRGMEEAVMERIFEPFFTTRPDGRGMGLAVTMGVVKSHKGHIDVVSAPRRGTTMTVWLPAAPTPQGVAPAPAQRSRPSPLPRGSETLLVIDDDPAVRRTVDAMLASLGYCVTSRGEPEEALSLLESNAEDFNLVLLDANLPRFSQEEMFDRVRALCPRAAVLLASGFDLQEQCAPLIARGAAGFVQKPFSMATLATQVRTALDATQH